MKAAKVADYYCTGCGLCIHNGDGNFYEKNGFSYSKITEENIDFCLKVCPCFSSLRKIYSNNNVWGNYENVWTGYSTNHSIRYRASSGGVITALCMHLIEDNVVDGIIHSIADRKTPWKTMTVCSKTLEEVARGCGSRYAQSSPLKDFENFLEEGKKYAFVGKPCDIYALNQYLQINSNIREKIAVTISFFCAGQPSENANKNLVAALLDDEKKECIKLDYRGNGWPGEACAISKSGKKGTMKYEQSWGKILGRDIRNVCRYCMIGTGECADISCGDAWKLTEDNKPSFNEGEGINVIFARSKKGKEILLDACSSGKIQLKPFDEDIYKLQYIQPSQYDRKVTMIAKVAGMKLFGKPVPMYDKETLQKLAKNSNYKRLYEVFRGTIGRIVRKKI